MPFKFVCLILLALRSGSFNIMKISSDINPQDNQQTNRQLLEETMLNNIYFRKPHFVWNRLMSVNEICMGEILIVSHKSFYCSIDFLECSPKLVP